MQHTNNAEHKTHTKRTQLQPHPAPQVVEAYISGLPLVRLLAAAARHARNQRQVVAVAALRAAAAHALDKVVADGAAAGLAGSR